MSQRITKAGKPHTITEDLLLPAAKDTVTAMLSEKAAKQFHLIPLSFNTEFMKWLKMLKTSLKSKSGAAH